MYLSQAGQSNQRSVTPCYDCAQLSSLEVKRGYKNVSVNLQITLRLVNEIVRKAYAKGLWGLLLRLCAGSRTRRQDGLY